VGYEDAVGESLNLLIQEKLKMNDYAEKEAGSEKNPSGVSGTMKK